jgi:hypothetical protein
VPLALRVHLHYGIDAINYLSRRKYIESNNIAFKTKQHIDIKTLDDAIPFLLLQQTGIFASSI